MQKLIIEIVQTSLKGDLFTKAIQCLQELRQACITEDEAEKFNGYMHQIKAMFSSGKDR